MNQERVRNKNICNINFLIGYEKKKKLNGQLTQVDRSNLLNEFYMFSDDSVELCAHDAFNAKLCVIMCTKNTF